MQRWCSYRKSSNKRRVSIKRRGYLSQMYYLTSIQLFTQLNSTQLLPLLLSHAGTPLNAKGGILPIVQINAGNPLNAGVFADCLNKRRGRLLEVLR